MFRCQVMIVESDADLRTALHELLRDAGHVVAEAGSEAAALAQLAAVPVVVLVDSAHEASTVPAYRAATVLARPLDAGKIVAAVAQVCT